MHFTLTLQHWDPFLLPCNLLWTQIILFITLVTLICFHAFDTQHTTLWPMSTPCKLLLSIWRHLGFVCRWHSRRGARFRQEIILWYDKITRRKAIQDCKLYYDRWKFVLDRWVEASECKTTLFFPQAWHFASIYDDKLIICYLPVSANQMLELETGIKSYILLPVFILHTAYCECQCVTLRIRSVQKITF